MQDRNYRGYWGDFSEPIRDEYNAELTRWFDKQLTTLNAGTLPFNCSAWTTLPSRSMYGWNKSILNRTYYGMYADI